MSQTSYEMLYERWNGSVAECDALRAEVERLHKISHWLDINVVSIVVATEAGGEVEWPPFEDETSGELGTFIDFIKSEMP